MAGKARAASKTGASKTCASKTGASKTGASKTTAPAGGAPTADSPNSRGEPGVDPLSAAEQLKREQEQVDAKARAEKMSASADSAEVGGDPRHPDTDCRSGKRGEGGAVPVQAVDGDVAQALADKDTEIAALKAQIAGHAPGEGSDAGPDAPVSHNKFVVVGEYPKHRAIYAAEIEGHALKIIDAIEADKPYADDVAHLLAATKYLVPGACRDSLCEVLVNILDVDVNMSLEDFVKGLIQLVREIRK